MMKVKCLLAAFASILLVLPNLAHAISVNMMMFEGDEHVQVGSILLYESDYGLVLDPSLSSFPAGLHGFHLHEFGSCSATIKDGKKIPGGAAGGHYDPEQTNKHGHPWSNKNHKGDLPVLYADMDGNITNPVLAPRLTLDQVRGRSLMIHVGGDSHGDHPHKSGGGGARMACGVIM